MRKLLWGKTIKSKLILYNFIVVCIISIVFSVNSYVSANKRTVEIAKNSLQHRVESISYRYQMAYQELLNIVLICSERKTFDLRGMENPDTPDTRSRGLEYSQNIRDFCAVTGYSDYILQLTVFNEKGALIQTSKYGSWDDYSRLLNTSWFENELSKPMDQYQLSLVDSPLFRGEPMMLPIAAALTGMDGRQDGWVMISLSPKLFEDVLRELSRDEETVVITYEGKRIAAINEAEAGAAENDEILAGLLLQGENQGLFEQTVHGKKSLIAYERYPKNGIVVYQVLPMESLSSDINMVAQTAIVTFGACLILGMTLSLIFTSMVRKPIDRLVNLIQTIAKGEFIQDPAVEREDEIGTIGKVVNSMSGHIDTLLEQRVNDEKEKSNLELKMLQAQINPHFLYNTLDSIRWIAIMQNNSGIVKMVTALSGLLKNMAKGFNEKVTLKKELEFLDDYVTIAKVKYLELFDLEIDIADGALYQAQVIKLTLQPLVENAIFNGIEPSGRAGIIRIKAWEEADQLHITVWDNGLGIPAAKLKTLLLEGHEEKSPGKMSGIGLSNVDKRIKLTYGEEFGLSIESVENEYTMIHIRQPLEFAEAGGETDV